VGRVIERMEGSRGKENNNVSALTFIWREEEAFTQREKRGFQK